METYIHRLLTENYNKYYRLAFSYVHNEHDAMDIVQEGAYKAILKCDTLKSREYADTWIYRIMINEALGLLRKTRREIPGSGEQPSSEPSREDEYPDMDLHQALEVLDPIDKTIITLRYFEELKIEQIADILEENINTIKSRLYRTLKKLRLSLEDEKEKHL